MAIKRGKARRRNEKITLSCFSFLFVALLSFMTVRNLEISAPYTGANETGNAGVKPAPTSGRVSIGDQAQSGARALDGHAENNPAAAPAPASNGPVAASFTGAYNTDLNVSRVDHSVAIKWDGEGTFAVYKCDSPKFDSCSIMEVVEGNSYLDKDENSGKIVYYRIEPLAKKG